MSELEYQEEVRLGAQGRMVIPAQLRQALDLKTGDALIARTRDGYLIVEKAAVTRQRLKTRYAGVGKRSLSKELVAERREEARRESGQ
jgi:AbrB family looped-hinge helix DNA binding protein